MVGLNDGIADATALIRTISVLTSNDIGCSLKKAPPEI